jgi:hypothetical protein
VEFGVYSAWSVRVFVGGDLAVCGQSRCQGRVKMCCCVGQDGATA